VTGCRDKVEGDFSEKEAKIILCVYQLMEANVEIEV
jgi:hypothetical protein